MSYWQNPNVDFLKPEPIYSDAATFFMRSFQAGRAAQLAQRQQEHVEKESGLMAAERAADNERDLFRITTEEARLRDDMQQRADLAREKAKQEAEVAKQTNGVKAYEAGETNPAKGMFLNQLFGLAGAPAASPQEAPGAAPSPLTLGNPFNPFRAPQSQAAAPQAAPDANFVEPAPQPAPMPMNGESDGDPVELPKLLEAQQTQTARPTQPTQPPPMTTPDGSMVINGIRVNPFDAAKSVKEQKNAEAAAKVEANLAPRIAGLPPKEQEFAKKALLAAVANAKSTGDAEKAITSFEKVFADYRGDYESMERGKVAARAAGQRQDKLTNPEREATAQASQMRSIADEWYSRAPMTPKAVKEAMSYLAEEEYYEKNPLAKAAAMRTGAYKDISERIGGNDLLQFYMSLEITTRLLRKETGASAKPSEWANVNQRYGRGPGDQSEQLEYKQRSLYGRIDEIAGSSRAGYGDKRTPKPTAGPKPSKDDDARMKRAGF